MRYKWVYPSEKTPPDVIRLERNSEWHVRVSSESEFAHGMRWGFFCSVIPPFLFVVLGSMRKIVRSGKVPLDEIVIWYMGFWLGWFVTTMTMVGIFYGMWRLTQV